MRTLLVALTLVVVTGVGCSSAASNRLDTGHTPRSTHPTSLRILSALGLDSSCTVAFDGGSFSGTCRPAATCQAEGRMSGEDKSCERGSLCCVNGPSRVVLDPSSKPPDGEAGLPWGSGEQRQPGTLVPPPAATAALAIAVPAAEIPDAYAVAPAVPTCPDERKVRKVCKENPGDKAGCDKALDLASCPAHCLVAVVPLSIPAAARAAGQTIDWVCQPAPGTTMRESARSDRASAPAALSRAAIIQNAVAWLQHRIRYSQRRYHGAPVAYRTDCSGFVSMAFEVPQFTTAFVQKVLASADADAREREKAVIERVACKSMLPGDAMVSAGHIVLFRRWTNRAAGEMELWEEKGTAHGTVASHNQFSGFEAMTEAATDGKIKGRGTYFCLRRKNIQEL